MGLKILHSADWHLDSPFAGFDDSQRALLRQEQQSIPSKTAQLCRREKCDLMLLAGDIFDGEPARDTVEALNHGSGFITRELGKRMQLRALPKLNFKLDNSIEYSVHISEIIDSLHKNEK